MKLSYSGNLMYQECPRKFKYKYIDKIKEKTKSSALLFGGSLDQALNCLLLTKKKNLTEEEQKLITKSPIDIFLQAFSDESLPIDYSYSDIDPTIFDDTDFLTNLIDHWKTFKIKDEEFTSYAKRSLFKKAKLFLESYENEVLPQIVEVYKVQTKIELPNEDGDSLIGGLDFTALFNDGKIYVVDNKTTSTSYKDDSASTSDQLAIYSEAEQNENVMYITIDKKLRKKNPRVKIKLIRGVITEEKKQEIFDMLGNTLYNIRNEVFDKKEDKGQCFSYGKRCPYFDLCWK